MAAIDFSIGEKAIPSALVILLLSYLTIEYAAFNVSGVMGDFFSVSLAKNRHTTIAG
jgi:hypothetical protein